MIATHRVIPTPDVKDNK